MSPAIRSRAMLVVAVLAWCALLIAQWAVGPRDGVVTELSRHTDIEVGIGPTLGNALGSPDGSEGARLALLLLIAPAVLVIAAHFAGRALRPGPRLIAAFAAVLGLLSFLELPQLSNDVFLYRSTGEMIAAEGLNPYLQTPADHFSPAQLRGIPWSRQKSPYGPLALGLFAAVTAITGSWLGSLWALRFLMAIPWVLAMILIRRSASTDSDRAPPLLFLAASPLLLLEVVQSGHLDGWIGLLLVIVCAALAGARPTAATLAIVVVALAAAIAIKLSVLAVTGAIFVHIARRPGWGIRAALLAGCGVLILVLLAWIPLWAGSATFDGLRAESMKVLQSIFQILQVPPDAAGGIATAGSIFALIAGMAVASRGYSVAASCVIALVLQALIGRSFLQPWYFVAPVLLAAWTMGTPTAQSRWERAVTDPVVWRVASVGLVFGAYGLVFATRSLSATIQTANVALMILPGLATLIIRARQLD